MTSTFFGFNIARSGLFASQRALNITSHNVANANTPGYTRQRLDVTQSNALSLPNGQGMIGTGVNTIGIEQLRNEFLDIQLRYESNIFGESEARADILSNIEAIINEPSDSGIRKTLDQFFSSLHELQKTPESLTVRALVRERSVALSKTINGMAEKFKKLQKDANTEIETTVAQINGYAEQIAQLNKRIHASETDGSKANDLRDQRNLLLDKLSKLTKIDYSEDSNNRMSVLVNGKLLVSHDRTTKMVCVTRTTKKNKEDLDGLYDIRWENKVDPTKPEDGDLFVPQGGKIKGLIDARDNISGNNKGIPYYMERLNKFADVMTEELNRVHKSGYGLDKGTGINLFTIQGMSTADFETHLKTKGFNNGAAPTLDKATVVDVGVTSSMSESEKQEQRRKNISNALATTPGYEDKTVKLLSDGKYYVVDIIPADQLTISADVENDLNKIAASESIEGVPGDGNNALAMANVRHDGGLYQWGSPDDFVKSLVSNLGVDTESAKNIVKNQAVLINQIETKKQSVSGVSLDEEMTNMIKFQHSFSANSRMITAMDEMISTIISKMGLVGR